MARRRKETWIDYAWRPAMAWSYLIICIFDFFVAPIIHATFQALVYPTQEYSQWKPITLAEGGLYHMAMMAIVGVTAWTRGQEKIIREELGFPERTVAVEEIEELPEEIEEEVEDIEPPPTVRKKRTTKR